jgi:hypothetical protein
MRHGVIADCIQGRNKNRQDIATVTALTQKSELQCMPKKMLGLEETMCLTVTAYDL